MAAHLLTNSNIFKVKYKKILCIPLMGVKIKNLAQIKAIAKWNWRKTRFLRKITMAYFLEEIP